VETVAVLADSRMVAAHREGEAAMDARDPLDADQLAEAMQDAERGPAQ